MASRGIGEAEARTLLTEAFIADALAGAPDLADRAVAWLRGMNAPAFNLRHDHRADFPGLADDWAYLDSAATAQKPAVVIDAIARAYGPEYATVHRGVYARSATMTERYEAARATVARFIGGSPTRSSSPAARPRRSTSSPTAGATASSPATAS